MFPSAGKRARKAVEDEVELGSVEMNLAKKMLGLLELALPRGSILQVEPATVLPSKLRISSASSLSIPISDLSSQAQAAASCWLLLSLSAFVYQSKMLTSYRKPKFLIWSVASCGLLHTRF